MGIIIGAGLSQRFLPLIGARDVPVIGILMAVAGLLLFVRLTPESTYLVDLLPGVMLASIGMGLTFVPITLIATSGILRRRRPSVRFVQHVSADRRRARPGRALHDRHRQDHRRDRVARALPSSTRRKPSSTASTSRIGSATMLASAAVLLVVLLRRRDVVAVAHGDPAAVAAWTLSVPARVAPHLLDHGEDVPGRILEPGDVGAVSTGDPLLVLAEPLVLSCSTPRAVVSSTAGSTSGTSKLRIV